MVKGARRHLAMMLSASVLSVLGACNGAGVWMEGGAAGMQVGACARSAGTLRLRGGAVATLGEVTTVGTKQAFDLMLQEAGDKLVVVDFTAQWCGPCQRIAPTVESMAIELRESCVFLKVDVDENEETSSACGVSCMPTFQLFRNTEKVGQMEGADEKALRALIDGHLQK